MIENIKNNHVTQMLGLNTPPRNDAAGPSSGNNSLDATLQVDFAHMVNRAMQAVETAPNAVETAKELLQSGRLITPENIRSAAEEILTFGI
ncbi:MAG: hypothetical protein KBI32_00330 [Phycisphaerae bacterium]|nr:hypothetical protein [Phycisphaerae bacterium]